ncbi:MAG: hypothetical protein ROO71_00830 [Balneola sp.]
MKIALIGNMNNNFFSLTRHLRDRNYEAELFMLGHERSHFHPECDSYDNNYESFTHKLNWGDPKSFYNVSAEEIRKQFKDYDFIIACDSAPAFLYKADIKIDIFAPYGSDIYSLPFLNLKSLKDLKKARYHRFFAHQKKGIQNSNLISCDTESKKESIAKLGVQKKARFIGLPMVYKYSNETYKLEENELPDSSVKKMIVIHQSRHIWKTRDDLPSLKRNDILIKGFADYVLKEKDAHLLLFEYGVDVEESKKLINDLGISEYVTWLPKMPRKKLYRYISASDIGTGQFATGEIGGGSLWEILAFGKPLMHYVDKDNLASNKFDEMYPFINVKNEDDITKVLIDFKINRDRYVKLGIEAEQWYKKNMLDKPVNEYVSLIEEKKMELNN